MRSRGNFLAGALMAMLAACGGNDNGMNMGATAPAITAQPASTSVVSGNTATFTVMATGSGLTYQWQKNGAPIGGATAASYTTPR